ncbi:MAG: 50S ribosomal protein L20, partial [Verrucomicrobia bacterium]
PLGISYSRFIAGLNLAKIELNRKSLSEIAIHNPEAFKGLVEKAQAALQNKVAA